MEMEDESSNSVEDHPFIIDSLADIMGELSEEEREETPKPTISQCNRYVYFNGKRIPKPSRVMELQRRGQLSSNLSPELLAYMYLDDEDLGLLFESHDPMQTLRVLYKEGFEQSDGETADPITKQELIEDAIKLKRLRDEGVISELPPLTEAAMNELIASAEDPSNKGSRTSKTEEAGTKHYNEGPLERRNREIVLQLIEHFPEEARVAGFKKDCATLLSNFYNSKDHSWEDFSKVWNRMRFSRVFNFHQIFGYRDLEKLYGVHNAERIHEGVIDPKNDDMQYYINRQMVRDGDECDDSVWNSVDNNQGENASSDKMENDGSENDENTVSDQKEGEGGGQEEDNGIDQEENDSSDQEEEDNIDEEEKASSVQSEPGESLVNSEKGNASGSVFQKYNIDSDVDDDNPDSNDDDIDAVEDRLIMQQVLRNRKKEKKNEKKARDNVDKSNDTKPVTEDEKNRAYAKIIMKMEDEEEWRLNFIRETTPKMFFIPKIFMLPEFPQPVRKGAIFMMYAMYYKQPFNAKCRPLTPDDDSEDEDDSEEEMQDETEEEMQDETEEEIQIETEDEIQDETEEKIHDETEKKKQVETEEKIQDESHENIQAVTHEETTNETQATRRRKSKGNFRFKYSKKFRKSQRLAKKQSKTQEETQEDEEKMKKREEQKMKRMEESRMKQEEEKEKKEEEKKKKRESKKKFKRKYKKKNEEEERKKEEFEKWNNVKAFYFDFDLTEFSLFRQIRDVESDEAQFQLNHIFTKMLEDSGIMMSGTFHDPMQMSISDLERAYYVRLYEEREGLKDPQQKIWWNEAIENYKRSTDEVAANSSLWNTVVKSSNKGDPSEIEHLLIPERPQHVVGKLEPSVTKNVSKSIKDYLAEYTEEITDTPDSPYELILLDDSDNLPPLRDAAAIIEVEMTPSEVDLTTIPSTEPSTSKAPTVRGPVIKMDRSTPSTSKGPAVATSIVDHSTPSTSKGPAVATSIVDRSTPSTSKKPAVATSIVDRSTPSTSKKPAVATSIVDRSTPSTSKGPP